MNAETCGHEDAENKRWIRTHPKQINYATPLRAENREEERTEPRVSHRGKGTEIVTVNILVYTDPVTNYTSSAQARPSQLSITGQAGARSTYG